MGQNEYIVCRWVLPVGQMAWRGWCNSSVVRPERLLLRSLTKSSQRNVNGEVHHKWILHENCSCIESFSLKIETGHQGNLKGISATTSPIYPGFQILNSLSSEETNFTS